MLVIIDSQKKWKIIFILLYRLNNNLSHKDLVIINHRQFQNLATTNHQNLSLST